MPKLSMSEVIALWQWKGLPLTKLLELAEEFEKNMRINFISSIAPNVLLVGGTFVFGWGLVTSIIIQQTTSVIAMYNSIRPLLQNNEENNFNSSPLEQSPLKKEDLNDSRPQLAL
ncbi:MAG: hypothetical protein AAF702_50505 [Chloroflexota bacterium]